MISENHALQAERDRLARELDEARKNAHERAVAKIVSHAHATGLDIEPGDGSIEDACNNLVQAATADLRAELASMRPVVEAARAWYYSSPRHGTNEEAIELVGAVLDYNSADAGNEDAS